MSDYKIGRVYKIECLENSNIIYVGSTFDTLKNRWNYHNNSYIQWININKGKVSIYPYFEKYNIKNFKIFLIKEYKVIDRKQLEVYETLWRYKLKSINKNNACGLWPVIKKSYDKHYGFINKSKILKRSNDYYYNNIDKVKEYREINKDLIKEYRKEYYELKKEEYNKKNNCICGGKYTNHHKKEHNKSNKHIKFLKSQ